MRGVAYTCDACGKQYQAIKAEWVRVFDREAGTVLWSCPNCGRIQKDTIHMYQPERAGKVDGANV